MMIKSWTREGIHKAKKVLVEKRLEMVSINLNYMCISCHVLILSSQNDYSFFARMKMGVNRNGSTFKNFKV